MSYRYQLCRDLAWVLTSPPLYQQGPFVDSAFLQRFAQPLWHKIGLLDQLPRTHFSNLNRRLGSYYEQLWLTLIDWHPDYSLLAHDLVINHHKRTLGSLDLLLKQHHNGEVEHWELAIKFYLNSADGYDPQLWLGPGRKDSLGNKLERMLTHQLPLSQSTQAKTALQQKGWHISRQRIVVQGRLYQSESCNKLPPMLAQGASLGRWYTQSSLPEQDWRYLSKSDWLAGRDYRLLPWWPRQTTIDFPKHLYNPSERQHVFVVPDDSEWVD